MKLSKDELIAKINEKVMDEDVKIELMEDITDSVETEGSTNEEDKQRIEELETKYNDLQEKYKERFLNSNTKEDKEDKEEMIDNEEEKTIDIKEI
jgi:hypothetical protein